MTNSTFRYSGIKTDSLYQPSAAAALNEVCIPLDKAKPGDILGLILPLRHYEGSLQCFHISEFVTANDRDGELTAVRTAFHDLDEVQQVTAALAVMNVQRDFKPWFSEDLDNAVAELHLDEESTHYADLIMLPTVALLVTEDYQDNVFESAAYSDDELDQNLIDQAVYLLAVSGTSAHEQVSLQERVDAACKVFASVCPVKDTDGDLVEIAPPIVSEMKTSA
jgi:hypothetical protein